MDSVLEATVYDFDRWSGNEVEGSVEIDITEEIARVRRQVVMVLFLGC